MSGPKLPEAKDEIGDEGSESIGLSSGEFEDEEYIMTEQEIIELRESRTKSKLSVNDFGSKKTNWNDKSIFEYFKETTKE